jgi:hypothetical protein
MMSEPPRKKRDEKPASQNGSRKEEIGPSFAPPEALWRSGNPYSGLKLIPWSEVWASIAAAKLRGNTEMLKVFYETLYKEALFDDRGVWTLDTRRRD